MQEWPQEASQPLKDFSYGSNMVQAKKQGGQGKYNLGYSKITKRWSSKLTKVKKEKTQFFELIDRTVDIK